MHSLGVGQWPTSISGGDKLMNKPLVFGLIIAATVTGAIAYGHWCMGSLNRDFQILLILTLGLAGSALWLVLRRTKAPDVLAKLGFDYFEREGFCFAAAPIVEDGAGYLMVVYQNRYGRACQAELLFKPDAEAALGGLKIVRTTVECPGAGAGRQMIPWEIPNRLVGRQVSLRVGADVWYPADRGLLVRWRAGQQVSSIEAAEAGIFGMLVGPTADLRIGLPQVITWGSLLRAQAKLDAFSAPLGPKPKLTEAAQPSARPAPAAQGREAGRVDADAASKANRHASPSDTAERGQAPARPAALSEASSRCLLETMSQEDAMARQRREVRQAKLGQAAAYLGWGVVALLASGAALAYGLFAFERGWRAPMRIPAIVLGRVGQFGALCLIGLAIYLALQSFSIGFARSAVEACRGACERALREFKDDARNWASVAEFVAYPEFSN